jgi:hypothetical protein
MTEISQLAGHSRRVFDSERNPHQVETGAVHGVRHHLKLSKASTEVNLTGINRINTTIGAPAGLESGTC